MEPVDTHVGSDQTALNQPKVFNSVSVNSPINVVLKMVDDEWTYSSCSSVMMFAPGTTFSRTTCSQIGRFAIRNDLSLHFPVALKQSNDDSLCPIAFTNLHFEAAILVHVPGLTADESFIHF